MIRTLGRLGVSDIGDGSEPWTRVFGQRVEEKHVCASRNDIQGELMRVLFSKSICLQDPRNQENLHREVRLIELRPPFLVGSVDPTLFSFLARCRCEARLSK